MNSNLTAPVKGYWAQTPAAIAMVNDNKISEERILRTIDDLQRSTEIDQRWLAIARTQLEQGFMALNRAVFRPVRVSLPEDEV